MGVYGFGPGADDATSIKIRTVSARLKPSLLCAAFFVPILSGCTSSAPDDGLQTGPNLSLADGPAVDLPETMPIPTSSFASRAPVQGMAVAALAPRPAGREAAEETAAPHAQRSDLDRLIAKYAALYEVPEGLVRRVVKRESNFRPEAYSKGNWGLMQIRHATARGMGYEGPASGLLDAETNLKYAVKYLRGAWLVAQGDQDRAVRFYSSGYYYDAKRMGLLEETGLGRDRRRRI
jgi:soluble lytic murein transglycosylase-like protein